MKQYFIGQTDRDGDKQPAVHFGIGPPRDFFEIDALFWIVWFVIHKISFVAAGENHCAEHVEAGQWHCLQPPGVPVL